MSAETVFSLANVLAALTWIVLVIFQRRRWATDMVVIGAVVLFAGAYVLIIVPRWLGSHGSFSSLNGVALLFSDPWLLLGGWIHYLAFDLLVGRWEAQDAVARGISLWFVAPCLLLTFLFGPAGWLLYQGLRLRRAAARAS